MVTQRLGEMGIRIAPGAGSADVHRLILGRGLGPVAAGLGIGALGALLLGRVMGSLLFDVNVADPATFAGVCGVLLVAAVLACWCPVCEPCGKTRPTPCVTSDLIGRW